MLISKKQCIKIVNTANTILGMIKISSVYKSPNVILQMQTYKSLV